MSTNARRAGVRRELEAGDVTGLKDLAARLEAQDISVTPEELRADVRALGAVRVQHGGDAVLALLVDDGGRRARGTAGTASQRLRNEVSADPDWRLQVGVAAVVVGFLVVGLLGWLISV